MDKKPNWSLIIALLLPVIMIVAVGLSIYVPSRYQTFQGQFLYAVQDGPYGVAYYGLVVVSGKLQEQPVVVSANAVHASTGTIRLYVHDLSTNESRDITLEEAKHLTLDPAPRSRDGLQIDYGNQEDGLFPFLIFSRTDYSAVYAKGDRGSRKLNVRVKPGNYYNQFQFIGWVKS